MLRVLQFSFFLELAMILFNLGNFVAYFLVCGFSQLVLGNIIGLRLVLCMQITDFKVSIPVPLLLILLAFYSFSQLTNSLHFQLCQSPKHSLLQRVTLSHVRLNLSKHHIISCPGLNFLIPRNFIISTVAQTLLYGML